MAKAEENNNLKAKAETSKAQTPEPVSGPEGAKTESSSLVASTSAAASRGAKNFAFYLSAFVIAIAKDAVEMVLGLIPFLNFLVMAVSLIFSILLTLILIFFGRWGAWKLAGMLLAQLFDCIPILAVLPLTTFTLILMILLEKFPASKTVSKVAKPISQAIK